MTDKQELVALLDKFGVRYELYNNLIHIPAGNGLIFGDKNDGYSYFFCDFEFDLNGKFSCVGVWE